MCESGRLVRSIIIVIIIIFIIIIIINIVIMLFFSSGGAFFILLSIGPEAVNQLQYRKGINSFFYLKKQLLKHIKETSCGIDAAVIFDDESLL